jgi:hypothetical protein
MIKAAMPTMAIVVAATILKYALRDTELTPGHKTHVDV